MAASECRCIVRGSINNDEYFYVDSIARPGETISSKEHASRVGGKGANQAIAIAQARGIAQFYGTIGKDALWVKKRMEEFGIDVSGILVSDEATGRAIIQVADDGENSIILFPGANFSDLHEQNFGALSKGHFPESTHILLQNEIPLKSTIYALNNAKSAVTILNPSPLPSRKAVAEFPWSKVDWLLVNASEVRDLCASVTGQEAEALSSISPQEAVSLLSAQSEFQKMNIICTLGSEGVLAFVPAFHKPATAGAQPAFLHVPAAKVTEVRDTTGAGDCFTGYFVQGLLEFPPSARLGTEILQADIEKILKVAVQAAGMCVEKPGTIDSIPTRGEVMARMSST
ncbi:Ribokinase-like protein [Crucibulum laeve]|uniref:Ribokinase n=1 Tax=Crucibulum laeve TaxID=68775 RepID=A0A5C3LZ26_9AGAR|nr:Ribokinase-like protein [Crucibulum laeve]